MVHATSFCSVIIVTNNSERHIAKAMECLFAQTKRAAQILLVDTGSQDPSYLEPYGKHPHVEVIVADKGIGFCRGNNIGWSKVSRQADYVFFLNPDAFLTPEYLENAAAFMENPENHACGALTGTTLGYDITDDRPTGKYDTTGVFPTWYGRWYDRGQGIPVNQALYKTQELLPAICGAVFFCRKQALETVLVRKCEVFDSTFYMYKEDIDLSLRLRSKGWQLAFIPSLTAYHCRGWNKDRAKMPKEVRLHSARNEVRIHAKNLAPVGLCYSALKYAMVKTLNM